MSSFLTWKKKKRFLTWLLLQRLFLKSKFTFTGSEDQFLEISLGQGGCTV